MPKSRLTVQKVLAWAGAHHRRTGEWPRTGSGAIPESPGDTWLRIDNALRYGYRGLEGGSSLARLLQRERGVPARRGRRRSARAWEALRLRRWGLTLKAIGAELGVTHQDVWQMLQRFPRDDETGPQGGRARRQGA
jgi:hypothetical protein